MTKKTNNKKGAATPPAAGTHTATLPAATPSAAAKPHTTTPPKYSWFARDKNQLTARIDCWPVYGPDQKIDSIAATITDCSIKKAGVKESFSILQIPSREKVTIPTTGEAPAGFTFKGNLEVRSFRGDPTMVFVYVDLAYGAHHESNVVGSIIGIPRLAESDQAKTPTTKSTTKSK